MISQSRYTHGFSRFSRGGAVLVALVGAAVMIAWFRDFAVVKSFLPGLTNMKIDTAFAFLASGIALWSLEVGAPASRVFARSLAVAVAAIGGLTLVEHLFGVNLGIDQLILRDTHTGGALAPGRMSAAAAFSFLSLGCGLLVLKARDSLLTARADWFALPTLFISTVALAGYAYDVKPLYLVGAFNPMAAHTALCFFVLSLSFLAADPERGIACIVLSHTAGGMVARRLLPTIPFILFGLGWIGIAGEKAGYFDREYGLALVVVLSMAVSCLAIGSTAFLLHAVDLGRERAEARIVSMNESLELRVQERTQELENTLAQVRQLSGMLPICAWCKKIRDDQDYWQSVEQYVTDRTDAQFSHSICPDCNAKFLGEEVVPASHPARNS